MHKESVEYAFSLEQALPGIVMEVYEDVAAQRDVPIAEVYHSRNCEGVAKGIARKLQENGLSPELAMYVGWEVTEHYFVEVPFENDIAIIDGTWQQFLDEPDPAKPKVLFTRKSELSQKLTALGVKPELHLIWGRARIVDLES